MAEKNLVEEALLQMENLQEAITNNAKGILASTMKEEISELVKESLVEPEGNDEKIEVSETDVEYEALEEQGDVDIDVEDEEGDMEDSLEDLGLDMGDDMESDNDEELEMGDDEMLMTDLPGDDLEVDDEEEVLLPLDLTAASDDEILKVFKAMGEDDGIIVKQDGDDVHLSDAETDAEYVIQLGESEEEQMEEVSEEEQMEEVSEEDEFTETETEEEDVVYEIEIGEEDVSEEWNEESEEEVKEEDEFISRSSSKEETTENQRVHGNLRKVPNGKHVSQTTKDNAKSRLRPAVRENKELKSEVQHLREKNEEYRKALNIFKEKLNEVAVFNSNLAYATRLFTEHSTTKQEKINILRRFDDVETLKESKSLYKTIKEDLGGKEQNVVTESVQSKVTKTPSKGSANNLIESKTYENPQFLRMKDLMSKLK